eukprot:462122-Rhodomonas_salina.1
MQVVTTSVEEATAEEVRGRVGGSKKGRGIVGWRVREGEEERTVLPLDASMMTSPRLMVPRLE